MAEKFIFDRMNGMDRIYTNIILSILFILSNICSQPADFVVDLFRSEDS